MSFLYLWRPTGLSPENAARTFAAVLERQVTLYEQAFGAPFALRRHQVGSIWIAQLEPPIGVTGWQPWAQSARHGVAWAGVCESHLGQQHDADQLADLVGTLANTPERAAEWTGRFAACAWDEGSRRVTLTTAAQDSPSLWWCEGPLGWAAGSRALPLLDLVGLPAELDLAAAGLFVSFGYLAGSGALFRHAARVRARRQIVLTPDRVESRAYVGLPEYLALGDTRPVGELALEAAEHLVARVGHQLARSERPQLLLTGGRDSRCIAAAAVAAGYGGDTRTSGPEAAPDVRIAARVAGALGVPHRREALAEGRSPMRALIEHEDRLGLWMLLTEGLETVRHAVAFQPFFEGLAPFPARREQVFHGLNSLAGDSLRKAMHGGRGAPIDAPVEPAAAREVVLAHVPPWLRVGDAARAAMLEELAGLDAELPHRLSAAHWCVLFYWQNRSLHWGADGMAVKDVIAWHWTPLLDRALTRAFFQLQGHTGKQLVEAVTVAVAPQLRGIPYDKQPETALSALKKRVKRALREARRLGLPLLGAAGRGAKIPVDAELLAFWQRTFFGAGPRVWPELIDEAVLRETIRATPAAESLWNLATVELAAAVPSASRPVSARAAATS